MFEKIKCLFITTILLGLIGCGGLMESAPPPSPELDIKPGRYFEDQPDLNNDYQIHFIYMLDQYGEDNEWDINGKMEKEVLELNEKMFELTGNKQKYKLDFRKDGKLDISFVRLDKRGTHRGWNNNYPDYFIQKKGFNNPKKLYYSWVDFSHRSDGGQMGPHHGYTFLKNQSNRSKSKRIKITLHELLHGQGFSWPCTEGDDGGHVRGSSIIGKGRPYILGSMIYEHENKGCPDLKDSVYLTPTSNSSYDPLPLSCMLAKRSGRGQDNWDFKWPNKYDHEKFNDVDSWPRKYWCTYQLAEYAKPEWFGEWD